MLSSLLCQCVQLKCPICACLDPSDRRVSACPPQLTILNKSGRIWTMVAGGGASVIYADTICELGGASELANYGQSPRLHEQTKTTAYNG